MRTALLLIAAMAITAIPAPAAGEEGPCSVDGFYRIPECVACLPSGDDCFREAEAGPP